MSDQTPPLSADERAGLLVAMECAWSAQCGPCLNAVNAAMPRLLATADAAEAERDAARAWAALWKRACASKRRVVRRLVNDLVRMGRAWDERDAALAREAGWRELAAQTVGGFTGGVYCTACGDSVDDCYCPISELRAALAAGPADRTTEGE